MYNEIRTIANLSAMTVSQECWWNQACPVLIPCCIIVTWFFQDARILAAYIIRSLVILMFATFNGTACVCLSFICMVLCFAVSMGHVAWFKINGWMGKGFKKIKSKVKCKKKREKCPLSCWRCGKVLFLRYVNYLCVCVSVRHRCLDDLRVLVTTFKQQIHCKYIQGGPKKVSQIIFAITLSTASQFP